MTEHVEITISGETEIDALCEIGRQRVEESSASPLTDAWADRAEEPVVAAEVATFLVDECIDVDGPVETSVTGDRDEFDLSFDLTDSQRAALVEEGRRRVEQAHGNRMRHDPDWVDDWAARVSADEVVELILHEAIDGVTDEVESDE